MAIVFRGLDDRELATWTAAMIESGERPRPVVGRPPNRRQALDRRRRRQGVAHPGSARRIAAAPPCRAERPRARPHGGTLDKLESIPGWQVSLITTKACSRSYATSAR